MTSDKPAVQPCIGESAEIRETLRETPANDAKAVGARIGVSSDNAPQASKTIVLFSALYVPSMGGVETYTENLARALAELGHRPVVATMDTHGVGERYGVHAQADDTGVEVVRLPCRNALGGRYPIPCRDGVYRSALAWLAEQRPDYVVVNARFYPLSCEGLAFARRLEIVPVLVEHGSAHLSMGGAVTSKAVEAVEHAMTARAKRYRPVFFAVSKKASAWLGHFGLASTGELPNAIDADAYADGASGRDFRTELGIGGSALLVVSAGRLIPEKGVEELAKAAGLLAERCDQMGYDVHVVMAGTGPLEGRLREIAGDTVHLVGRLSHADLAALFSQSDALCLPSRSEGFATTLLEAAACGVPAIVTDVGGTDELIPDERFGTILADRRPETIAAALTDVAAEREKLIEQGRAVAGRVRELCSWQHTARLTIAACEQAQKERK